MTRSTALVGCGGHGRQEYIRDLKCQACQTKFSVRYGTVLYRLKPSARRMGEVLSALAEGLSVSAAVRVFGYGEFTIRTWLTRAGLHATSLHERLFQNLKLLHIQLDAAGPSAPRPARALTLSGFAEGAVDACTKVIAVVKAGPRPQPMAHAVVHALVKVLAPDARSVPVFTSDGLKLYFYALTAHSGSWAEAVGKQSRRWQVRAAPPLASTDNSPNTTATAVSSALSAAPGALLNRRPN